MINKRFKNKFFSLAIKSPAITIVIILLAITGLFFITYTSYTNLYLKCTAEIEYKDGSESPLIQLFIDKKDIQQIEMSSDAIWYLNEDGKRYKASIIEMEEITEKNAFLLKIKLAQNDVIKELQNKKEGVQPVYIEILTGREKIFNRLFNRTEVRE